MLLSAEGGFNPFEFVPGATIWTWVAFLLALPLMWKFVFGPITSALEDRDNKVEDAIKAAEQARRDAEEQTAATKAELERARAEAKTMVAEATARAERQAEEQLAKARAEADRQMQAAREQIEASKHKALLEIRQEVVDLAIQSAGRILENDVNDDAHRKLVGEFLETVKGAS